MKYWGEDQEDAIVEFNTNDDIDDKHKVFVAIIEPAFRKLVENIYYTYNFNKILWDREQIEHEVMTHLYEKLSKFDVTKNKKSFSYFGTITKNWMIQRCNTDKNKRFIDADNQDMIVHNISINAYEENKLNRHNEEFIGEIIEDFNDWDAKDNYTRDDFAVLEIVNDILKNYERFNIYNKKQLYVYIREATDLPSRKITKSLKKIKLDYFTVREDFISEIIKDFDDWDAKDNYTRDDFAVLEIVNDILKNYERFNIYNKKQLYVYIREATDLPSRKITKSLKKIKINYGDVRGSFIG